jgi:membrane protein
MDVRRAWVRGRALLLQVVRNVDGDNVIVFAAGLAFCALLSVVPVLGALVSTYGLVSDPAGVER